MSKNKEILIDNVERFSPNANFGLTDAQVNDRTSKGLTNNVNKKYSKSYLSIFAGNICTFFNLLGLIVATALIVIKAPIANFFFVAIYIANIGIGIIQEIRAKRCIDKLSIMSGKNVKVIRNGIEVEILPKDIVLDDVICLGIGSQIPSDGVVLSGDIEVNESLLTGESVPVKKRVGDQVFAGSFIVSGTCHIQATKVGKDNYVETLSAKAKKYKKPHSELIGSIHLFIKIIGIIIVPIATALMLKSMLYIGLDYTKAIDGTAQIVIGMIPSGMFLLTSLALAVGVIKLARHKTLVQDLYSLEMLARVDTICFDKTGTITDGKMNVKELAPIRESNIDYEKIIGAMLGALKDNNQTAIALYEKFGENNEYNVEAILPFNSARKLSAVTFKGLGTYAFGAPEFVLDDKKYLELEEKITSYAKQGLRVLILAHSNGTVGENSAPKDFEALALIVIEDNIRADAIDTIKWFKKNNVAIKVISGDNPITVAEVSKRVGVEGAENYISLENLSDEEVYKAANEYTVFGRVSPEQKAILVKALKDAGHVTAMTGDGVNDILALKEADCAITVASGSDAARNVSNIVLLDNNFNSMPQVVYEGRRVINNVQSSASLFIMKTLFNMFMAIIILAVPTLQKSPFSLMHTILLEVFIIGVPSFFLSLQANDSLVQGKFLSYVLVKSLPSAIIMLISFVAVYVFAVLSGGNIEQPLYKSMAVYAFTLSGLVSLFFICMPFNKFRTIIFSLNAIAVVTIITISIVTGFGLLTLSPIIQGANTWKNALLILGLLIIDIPLLPLLQMICKKIKLPNLKKKK